MKSILSIRILAGLVVVMTVVIWPTWMFGAPSKSSQSSALTNWQTALTAFQQAGSWIAEGKHQHARTELSTATTNLPAPYGPIAAQFLAGLDKALPLASASGPSDRVAGLVELCSQFGAYAAASRLQATIPKPASADDEIDDPLLAWRLLETGETAAALAEYERKLADERVNTFKAYYRKQIEMVKERTANLTNAQFSLEWVREHYLKGYETKVDLFGALTELTRVLPLAKTAQDALDVQRMLIQCLARLGDIPGVEAWEDKTLSDFKQDPEACAEVHLSRGLRAYGDKKYEQAVIWFRKVCREYPNTLAYGDAQYDLGSALQEQKKHDEAIEEFNKLLSSSVNDLRLTPGSSDDYRNYRHKAALRISECYEAKRDYGSALQYAEMARTQYKPLSWCSTCLNTSKEALDRYIQKLQDLASKSK